MSEFLTLTDPKSALSLLMENLRPQRQVEWVEIQLALGRVTALPVHANHPLPAFQRSTVDGYAVRAADTFGSSDTLPVYLRLAGEVPMGAVVGFDLMAGQCALIHTGGMLPDAADAVVMLEYTQMVHSGEVEIFRAVAPGENIIQIGEDVEKDQIVIPAGCRMRPAEIGGVAALGIHQVAVVKKPSVAILSSGDEVVPLHAVAHPGQVYDVNTYTLSSLVEQSGGQPVSYGILPDDRDILEKVARRALQECDMVIFTAGSSASTRDVTSEVVNNLG